MAPIPRALKALQGRRSTCPHTQALKGPGENHQGILLGLPPHRHRPHPSYHPPRGAAAGALAGLEDTSIVARIGAGAGEANTALETGHLTAAGQSREVSVYTSSTPSPTPPPAPSTAPQSALCLLGCSAAHRPSPGRRPDLRAQGVTPTAPCCGQQESESKASCAWKWQTPSIIRLGRVSGPQAPSPPPPPWLILLPLQEPFLLL